MRAILIFVLFELLAAPLFGEVPQQVQQEQQKEQQQQAQQQVQQREQQKAQQQEAQQVQQAQEAQQAQVLICADSCGVDGHEFKFTQLIAPVTLIGVGALGFAWDDLKELDFGIADKDAKCNQFGVEDITQYLPMASFYVLKLSGVKTAHNYRDASVILATSYVIMAASSQVLKYTVKEERPNKYNNKSFPSGHAATAFMGAEFLRREYKDSSPWIAVAGYAVASGTAIARIYHNEHWITDVLAGAGIGILSTNIAYWIYPKMQKILFGKSIRRNNVRNASVAGNFSFMGMPYYNGQSTGLAMVLNF